MFAFVSLLAWVPEAKANLMTGKPLSSTQPRSIAHSNATDGLLAPAMQAGRPHPG